MVDCQTCIDIEDTVKSCSILKGFIFAVNCLSDFDPIGLEKIQIMQPVMPTCQLQTSRLK